MVHYDDGVRDARLLLDDKAQYGHVGQDWAQVLLRLPFIPDTIMYLEDPDGDEGSIDLSPLPHLRGLARQQSNSIVVVLLELLVLFP
jgi:hypothetical protein